MLPCELFRARAHRRDAADQPATASELGSPPEQRAIRSNRMSPIGIPMFYAAIDEAAAVEETRALGIGSDEALTVGVFRPDRPLNVVNLVSLPPIPTVFEQHRLDVRPQLIFLHHFAAEVSKPVDRSQTEHLEYVPTQIVTEYFRHVYGNEHGTQVDGLRYGSAVQDGGECVVLFVDNEQCVDAPQPGERTLALDRAYCVR
jgi:hypothetical protein